jgi:hypothetical protein
MTDTKTREDRYVVSFDGFGCAPAELIDMATGRAVATFSLACDPYEVIAALRPAEPAQARAEVLEAQVRELKGEVAWEAGLRASALERAARVAEDWASRDDLEGRHIGDQIAAALRALALQQKDPAR